jgi:hypothetical protein
VVAARLAVTRSKSVGRPSYARSGNEHLQSLVARSYIFCMPELGLTLSVKINTFSLQKLRVL